MSDAYHERLAFDSSFTGVGIGVREVGRAAQHRHHKPGPRNRLADLVEIIRIQAREKALVHFQTIGIQRLGHFNPFKDGHGARASDVVEVTLWESGDSWWHVFYLRVNVGIYFAKERVLSWSERRMRKRLSFKW
jgi:hypothetical protein